jgi:predicted esterase YcpF (UPF0227 family)
MSKTVVYLHGYTGEHGYNANSGKIQAIKKYCDANGMEFVNPRYPDHDPKASHKHLSGIISEVKKKDPHPILVGTSLGGYWAHRLSNEHQLPSVLINPAIEPHKSLDRHVNAGRMTPKALKDFEKLNDDHASTSMTKEHRHVLLEAGDDVIDPHKTKKLYTGHATVKMFPEGNHMFTRHDEIVKSIDELKHSVSSHSNHA